MLTAICNSTHLCVKIRASTSSASTKAINLALLVDTSGSMDGDRLTAVKRTLHAARELFQPDDRITLVIFSSTAKVITDHLRMDAAGLAIFYAAVDSIQAGGNTNLSAGLEALSGADVFDTILVLTDGIVNGGITSAAGLRSMALGLGAVPYVTLGYGADHNRVLLRDLALNSHGSYTFVDSESILPMAMGDMIGGIRTELFKNTSVRAPSGWVCCELASAPASSSFTIGSIIPDRDYWVVFSRVGTDIDDGPVHLLVAGETVESAQPLVGDCLEQVLRCRVARALVNAADAMENGRPLGTAISELLEEFRNLPPGPLILRMRAQLEEAAVIQPRNNAFLARLSSGGAYLSTQRGVSSHTPALTRGQDPQEPDQLFSSPGQVSAASQVRRQF